MKKTAVRIAAFFLILMLCLGYANSVFKFKYGDGIYDMEKFYLQPKDTVDVLVLGSSHAFENFNTGLLWDEFGMAAFLLGGSVQPMWNTYHFLVEALKTQTPKLIILEGYRLVQTAEYMPRDTFGIKNLFGMHWSRNKLENLAASFPEERRLDFALEYTQYHTRYGSLTREDFFSNQGNPMYEDWKGFGCNMLTRKQTARDVTQVTDRKELAEKTEHYYRAILDLAQEKGIPIAVIVTPYSDITENYQKMYNTGADIAAEKGIPFLNCNLLIDEIGIDYTTDAPDGSHLNYKGNVKFTRYVGEYLKALFDIPDRRDDPRFDSWQRQADFIRRMIADQELVDCRNATEKLMKTRDPDYLVFVSRDGKSATTTPNKKIMNALEALGVDADTSNSLYYLRGGEVVWMPSDGDNELFFSFAPNDFLLSQVGENRDAVHTIMMNSTQYKTVDNGINIVVYDTVTEKLVQSFALDGSDSYKIKY